MEKKKLLIMVPNLAIGGQQRVAVNTAAILEKHYEVIMAVFTMEGAVYNAPCKVIDLNIPPESGIFNKLFTVLKRVKALKKWKRNIKIDVAFSFGKTANLANALSKVADKVIVSVHGYGSISRSRFTQLLDKVVYARADTVVCVAEKITRDLATVYHLPTRKVVTLHNPYDFGSITEQARSLVPLEIKHPVLVTMGRMEKIKGYRHLLNAFAIVQSELPESTLVFVGEGSERQTLEQIAADVGLEYKVVFVGFQSNPYSYLSKCDVYLLSSIHEGFPNAMIEAMACGLPVIATDCKSGPREILTKTYIDRTTQEVEFADYGILVPPFAADDSIEPSLDILYADAILQLLTNEHMYEGYKEKAKERAKEFSFENYRDKIIKIIEGQNKHY